jgi:hypothetical protein
MAEKSKLFAYRGPMYFGGLLLGLAAGIGFYKAKKAMMPHFHEQQDARPQAMVAPGGYIKFTYGGEDPGYFLIYGMPTNAAIYKKGEPGQPAAVVGRMSYRDLTEKEPSYGPMPDEGEYNVDADFYICAEPGVADCTKLNITEDVRVDRNAPTNEAKIDINLPKLAQDGLKQGNMEGAGNERNQVSDKDIEEKKEKVSD